MEDLQAGQLIIWPLVTRERFAELTGLSLGQVDGMVDRRYLPSKKVGKHRLINLALITNDCLEAEEWE